MTTVVYIACTLIALLCAIMLFRAYRRTRLKLLLWSTFCFCGLTLSNLLVIVDKNVAPQTDLFWLRASITLISLLSLLYGLIMKSE